MNKSLQQAFLRFASFFKAQSWPPGIQRPWLFSFGAILLCLGLLMVSQVDHHELQQWQPLMAAMVALAAATIAYRSAMAKVTFDREQAQQALERQKIGLHLRLRLSIQVLKSESKQLAERTTWWVNPDKLERKIITVIPNMDNHPEINEAWVKLEYFSVSIGQELHRIRLFVRLLNEIVDKSEFGTNSIPSPHVCKSLNEMTKKILPTFEKILELIKAEISA